MTVIFPQAGSGLPLNDGMYIVANAGSTAREINPGDYVAWSGQNVIAAHDGVTYWKASGVGIALSRNPTHDPAGRLVVNSAIIIARRGAFMMSANFSGQPNRGVLAYPDMTGSGVGAPSGATGLGSVWNTANPVTVSGGTGAAPVLGVAQVIGWRAGAGGTGQLEIALWDRNADYY